MFHSGWIYVHRNNQSSTINHQYTTLMSPNKGFSIICWMTEVITGCCKLYIGLVVVDFGPLLVTDWPLPPHFHAPFWFCSISWHVFYFTFSHLCFQCSPTLPPSPLPLVGVIIDQIMATVGCQTSDWSWSDLPSNAQCLCLPLRLYHSTTSTHAFGNTSHATWIDQMFQQH